MPGPYDIVVVGAGLSGLQLVTTLARHGLERVAVVDAGGFGAGPAQDAPIPGRKAPHLVAVADPEEDLPRWRPWVSEQPPHYAGPTGLRRRIGGRSLCWHGVVLPLEPWETEVPGSWPDVIRKELTGSGNDGLYALVEQELSQWVGGPLDELRSESGRYLFEWVKSLGYSTVQPAPLAVRRVSGSGADAWQSYSPIFTWQEDWALDAPFPEVLTGREVIAVRAGSGRVAGVEVINRRTRHLEVIPCERVILAAGTIENTRLAAQAAQAENEPVRVFNGLNDHIVQGFVITVPVATWGDRNEPDGDGGCCLVVKGGGEKRFNLFFKLRSTPSPDFVKLDVWTMGEQERSDLNRVSFVDTRHHPWTAKISTGLSAADREVVIAEQNFLQEVSDRIAKSFDLPSKKLAFGDFRNDQSINTADEPGLPIPFASALGSLDHEAGTLPFGTNLNLSGQVIGCDGLYVTGPAAFPRSGAANPSLTTLALAHRLAAHIQS